MVPSLALGWSHAPGAHTSYLAHLAGGRHDIRAWADAWNENPTPFVWHKTAEQILERLAAYCGTINAATA